MANLHKSRRDRIITGKKNFLPLSKKLFLANSFLKGKIMAAISPKREKELHDLGYPEKVRLVCKTKKQIAAFRKTPRSSWSKEIAAQYALLRKELNFLKSCWSYRKLPVLG